MRSPTVSRLPCLRRGAATGDRAGAADQRGLPAPPRRFASDSALAAEDDLAERSEDILREDPDQPE